jgi:hypothetical protein
MKKQLSDRINRIYRYFAQAPEDPEQSQSASSGNYYYAPSGRFVLCLSSGKAQKSK